MKRIPLVDLKAQYKGLRKPIDRAIRNVIKDAAFYKGKYVEEFERRFAEYIGTNHCVGVANCTDALFLVLKALGIGKGHEVITAANTFIATSEAVTATGARVKFVDIDPKTLNMDTGKLEKAITMKAKAIIPVHLCGRAVDMDSVMAVSKEYQLFVIEDCAQACGAEHKGKKVGSIGDAGCFSFYPAKNLGAYGDAGAVITNSGVIHTTVRMLADHGRIQKYEHLFEGYSSRLDGLQAAILSAKLPHLDDWNFKRYRNACLYRKHLDGIKEIILPDIPKLRERKSHVFHTFILRVDIRRRDKIRIRLKERGIETGLHYPQALPNSPAYSYLKYLPRDFPVASRLQDEILSLPMYPELTEKQIKYITDCLKEALDAG